MTDLIKRLSRLPGIGEKSAMRMVLFLLDQPDDEIINLGESIGQLKNRIRFCRLCHTLTDLEVCSICGDGKRDRQKVCVVEEPADLLAIEQSGSYRGLYHVLHGAISPLDGVGPENLKIDTLSHRIKSEGLKEVILATNPTAEGEATAYYLYELLKDESVTVTRIAFGLPMGGDIKFTDNMTLRKALDKRSEM